MNHHETFVCTYMGFTVSNGVPAIVSWGNSRRKKKNRGREGRLDATEKKRRGEAGKVSHQGSPNFKLLIHRQSSSSAPKAFCYCHCPEDFAQEFEEQKKKTSKLNPSSGDFEPPLAVGIVFSSIVLLSSSSSSSSMSMWPRAVTAVVIYDSRDRVA